MLYSWHFALCHHACSAGSNAAKSLPPAPSAICVRSTFVFSHFHSERLPASIKLHDGARLQTVLVSHTVSIWTVLTGLISRGPAQTLRRKDPARRTIRLQGRPGGASIIRGMKSAPHVLMKQHTETLCINHSQYCSCVHTSGLMVPTPFYSLLEAPKPLTGSWHESIDTVSVSPRD